MFLKKMWGCDCTVCIAGGGTHACLGTAPSGTGVRTYDCGACENLLTVLDMISTCERRADFCGGGVGSTAPPCVTSGGLSGAASLRSPSASPTASGVLLRSLGCALGRARSWLLLCCRLRWRAEGVSLSASPGGHLCWRRWRAEPASLLARCGCGVSSGERLTRATRTRHPSLEYLSALLLFFELGSHCDHCLPRRRPGQRPGRRGVVLFLCLTAQPVIASESS